MLREVSTSSMWSLAYLCIPAQTTLFLIKVNLVMRQTDALLREAISIPWRKSMVLRVILRGTSVTLETFRATHRELPSSHLRISY